MNIETGESEENLYIRWYLLIAILIVCFLFGLFVGEATARTPLKLVLPERLLPDDLVCAEYRAAGERILSRAPSRSCVPAGRVQHFILERVEP